ncbi:importin subunit beta-1 [Tanacetum coccineum]
MQHLRYNFSILSGLDHVKKASLETLRYLCEEVSLDVAEEDQVNKILTAVVQDMNATEGSNDVKLVATRALYNALSFTQAVFSNDMERDYIMKVVCELTLSAEVKIRQGAFACLVSISSSYYEKIAPYMRDIFNITAKALKEDEEPVALQAIEHRYFGRLQRDSTEEDQDQDEGAWNIAMAGGMCLGLVARTVGDDIVPLVMPLIE